MQVEIPKKTLYVLLKIQGKSCPMPAAKENATLRFHLRRAVKLGVGEVVDGKFRFLGKISTPALCAKCSSLLHMTSSGVHCPKCRNGIKGLNRDDRLAMKRLGVTWSE